MGKQPQTDPVAIGRSAILAAGGIVRGQGEHDGRILLVHRCRYAGEISLPKGKVKQREDVAAAALREVREETGYHVGIDEYAGRTQYLVGQRQKLVFYFIMRVTTMSQPDPVDATEIEAAVWVTPLEALSQLTHGEDRVLIASVFCLNRG
jgi:8-oxo-dGTP diphosphatase